MWSVCSVIPLSGQKSKLVQLCLTATNSPQPPSLQSALSVSAQSQRRAYKNLRLSALHRSPPFLHYGSVQSQLCLCGRTHRAIHHRWQRFLWKLAAMLPLGKKCMNEAKMTPGEDFFEFTFRQPCLSCCNRITDLFYLAKD